MSLQQPFSIDNAKQIVEAHHDRDARNMNAPLLLLEVQANALEQERRNKQLMNEQLRIARLERHSHAGDAMMALRNQIGVMLIGLGGRIRQEQANMPELNGEPDGRVSTS